jgi:hypothetical protein
VRITARLLSRTNAYEFEIRNLYIYEKPTDVTISILYIYRRISTCFGSTGPSSVEFTQLFTQPLVQCLYGSGRLLYSHWTNGCVNSCVNSLEDGPVGPKHVEISRYMNKIEIVTSVDFSFYMLKGCTVQRLKKIIQWEIFFKRQPKSVRTNLGIFHPWNEYVTVLKGHWKSK